MLAMLRKDLYVMKHSVSLYALMWAADVAMLAWIPNAQFSTMAYILPLLLGNTVLYSVDADEKCHWDSFTSMTPLRPRQIVLAKYLLAYGLTGLMTLLGLLVSWVSTMGGGNSSWVLRPMAFVLVWVAMFLPLRYRFQRGQAMMFVFLFWVLIVGALLSPKGYWLLHGLLHLPEMVPLPLLAVGGAAAMAALNALSIKLSVRFYTSRQRGWYDRG